MTTVAPDRHAAGPDASGEARFPPEHDPVRNAREISVSPALRLADHMAGGLTMRHGSYPGGAPAPAPGHTPARLSPIILRFLAAERMLHWALAAPFVLLYGSALILVVSYAEPSPRHIHNALAWLHRAAGVALIALPPLALLRGRSQWRIHLENMTEGWRWARDDFRWLVLFPRNAVDPRVTLPEQGKLNAAEKLNFMMVSATYPLYIATGVLVWLPGDALPFYLAHAAMAVLGLPLVLGHIFMATINPATRIGLSGMITGWVDREWAKHHYRRWYRDRFEATESERATTDPARVLARPVRFRCSSCRDVIEFGTWQRLIERAFQVEPLFCPRCNAEMPGFDLEPDPEVADAILRHLELGRANDPIELRAADDPPEATGAKAA